MFADQITAAEWRVFELLADGRSPAQIAAQLGKSMNTIRSQLLSLRQKIGVDSNTRLVVWWYQTKLERMTG